MSSSNNLVLGQREKRVIAEFTADKTIRVHARFSDPYHEIEIEGLFSHPDLTILALTPRIIRFPHGPCRDTTGTLQPMVGRRVQPGLMKKLVVKTGSRGCTHLNALFKETVEGALLGRGRRIRFLLTELFPGISTAQLYKVIFRFRPELMDSCNAYRKDGELMEWFLATSIPEDMDLHTIQELESLYESAARTPQAAAVSGLESAR